MTQRPKKVNIYPRDSFERGWEKGFNRCHDKMEAFLPSEEELKEIIAQNVELDVCDIGVQLRAVAKAIHKRLRG